MESCEAGQEDRKAAHLAIERPEPFPIHRGVTPTKETLSLPLYLFPAGSSGGTNRLQAQSNETGIELSFVSLSQSLISLSYSTLTISPIYRLSLALDLCVLCCL
jgi:hypothetical protein